MHCVTGVSPSFRMFSRAVKTNLDFIKERNEQYRHRLIRNFNGKRNIEFKENKNVYARDYRDARVSWKKGIIVEVLGKDTYFLKIPEDDIIWKRHCDQLIKEDYFERTDREVITNDIAKDYVPSIVRDKLKLRSLLEM